MSESMQHDKQCSSFHAEGLNLPCICEQCLFIFAISLVMAIYWPKLVAGYV